MPLTGVEPARMNRKKGDKGFESPRPYKLTHQVVCINNINFQRKSVVEKPQLFFQCLCSCS
ncbi:TAF2 isoform 9 [Pan troglodytes]|uniref:TATA-box binding protein associated factor 2 n=2 Tax=Homininae TaxID=207598 RepID=A0A8I5KNG3_HUMAN|nr:TATA-box binding protein associated factor 2 [Homo sapiens]KAI4011811.1 TATA-box binding protein associated factor 2 [Homo sapiens]PNI85547.1 TAF2 isoform 9 [Pan troglodytes]